MGNICLEIGGSLEAVSGGEDISAGAHRPRAGLGKVAELENPEVRGYFFYFGWSLSETSEAKLTWGGDRIVLLTYYLIQA